MVLFLEWLGLMLGDGVNVLHSWNDLAKMSLDGSFLEWFGLIMSGDDLNALHS